MSLVRQYCKRCASEMKYIVPVGDDVSRFTCGQCGHIDYDSPIPTISTMIIADGKILLVRRAIPPYMNKWAPPGGFAEKGESMTEAAVRETFEETGIAISEDALVPFFMSSITTINQYYISFRAHLNHIVEPVCGPEASDAAWFGRSEFPTTEYWMPNLISTVSQVFDCIDSQNFKVFLAKVSENEFRGRSFPIGNESVR
jgi:ADP-ribose pyrophosphatase YjhB (NUDIX family)